VVLVATGQLRVGFVGAGEQVWESLIPAFQALAQARDGVEVFGVADVDFARAQWVARDRGVPRAFRSQQEMLDTGEVDAVVIAVPHAYHASEGLKALTAGCHVFVEKPMATNAAEARLLLQKAQERDLVLMVDYQYPRSHRKVLAALDNGLVGRRYEVQGSFAFTDGFPNRSSFWDSPRSGGVRLDYLGHLLSVTLAALGRDRTPLAVSAQGWNYSGKQAFGSTFQTQSRVVMSLRFAGNGRAELEVDWGAPHRKLGIEVLGHKGAVEIPMMAAELQPLDFLPTLYRRQPDRSIKKELLGAFAPTPIEASFAFQVAAFDDAIRRGIPLRFPFGSELALTVQELLDAAGRSIERNGAEESVRRPRRDSAS
jgi:predicted dehydrogenase